jgi:hypothetical protein
MDIWRVVATGSQWVRCGSPGARSGEWFPGSNREQGTPERSEEGLMKLEVIQYDEAQS